MILQNENLQSIMYFSQYDRYLDCIAISFFRAAKLHYIKSRSDFIT